jgi:hypothetical protein
MQDLTPVPHLKIGGTTLLRHLVIGFVLLSLLAIFAGAAPARTRTNQRVTVPCSGILRTTGPFVPEAAIRAARRAIPNLYASLVNQGGRAIRGPKDYRIVQTGTLMYLQKTDPYRKAAAARCSQAPLESMWFMDLDLISAATVESSKGEIILARRASGWFVWLKLR